MRWFLLCLLLSLSIPGCATRSDLVNMWVDPDNPPAPMKRLLVVALWEDMEPRQVWEEGFVATLAQNGVKAAPSYFVAPYLSPDSLDIAEACARAECEGFIVVHRNQMETRTVYVPGYTTTTVREVVPYELYCQTLRQKKQWIVTEQYHPGSVYEELALRCDVDVWMLDGDRMVWTGTTEVINPISDQHACYKVSDTVVFELSRRGIVPAGL